MAKEPPEDPEQSKADRAELAALFQSAHRKVVYYFLKVGLDPEDAREQAQETFVRAHRFWHTFRGESSRETWLFEIAHNIFKNLIRDRKAQKRDHLEVPLQTSEDPERGAPPEAKVAAPGSPADERVLLSERRRWLRIELQNLPPQRRQCLELRLRDLPYNEIAKLMGISIETVKSHLHQAREALRKAASELDNDEG